MAPLQIHILDIVSRDQKVLVENEDSMQVEFLDNDDSSDDEFHNRRRNRYHTNKATERTEMLLHIFGSTTNGTPVRIDVTGFTPFFYLRVPDGGNLVEAKSSVEEYLVENIDKRLVRQIKIEPMMREVLFQFTANEKFPFLKLTMPSLACYRTVRNLFLNPETQLPHCPTFKPLGEPFQGPPKVYEANLDPMLRFIHLQDLAPCGWVEFETLQLEDLDKQADGTLTGVCEHSEVHPCSGNRSAPFSMVSWDIECFSASGDFPIASKKFGNVIKPLLDAAASPADFGARFVEAVFGPSPTIRLTKSQLKRQSVTNYVLSENFMNLVMPYTSQRNELKMTEKQELVKSIGANMDKTLGRYAHPEGDPVIQIGNVVRQLGSEISTEKHLFVLGSCDPIEGVVVHTYKTEAHMILGWCQWIAKRNPDKLLGYNIFGFDSRYVWDRARELGLVAGEGWHTEVVDQILRLSRLAENGGAVRLEEKFLSSSALGDNFMHIILMQGRLQIDLYNYVKRSFNLPSYKLDEVTKNFMSGKHKSLIMNLTLENNPTGKPHLRLGVGKKIAAEVGVGRSIVFLDALGESLTEKLVVLEVSDDDLILDGSSLNRNDIAPFVPEEAARWVVVKDDVSPQELFVLHCGSSSDRAKIGRYCIQDCELVLDLYKKLDVFNNAMSMANVCSVPVNYIFSRGQGIKCESLIFKVCHRKNQAIEVLPAPKNRGVVAAPAPAQVTPIINENDDDENEQQPVQQQQQQQGDDSYEGAIVLEPKAGFYTESPVGVCDFASLYPNTIISENISHDSLVWIRDYDEEGNQIADVFGSTKYDNMPDLAYTDIEFDLLRPDPADTRKNPTKIKVGTRVCRYAQGRQGTIPEILQGLLAKRKATRELIKKESDPFRIALLDAEQNAYKITANSLYGQLGSGTFKVRLQSLAASVTAYGRKQILFAKAAIEKFYGPEAKDPRCSAEIVYGDTDSLFVSFNVRNPLTGERLVGKEAVEATIRITEEAGKFVSGALKAPHDFEFDKVYWPFLIFSKKRYIGNMYEEDADHFKQAFMGVALKRRDYAQIVKTIYGGAIKILLNQRDVPAAVAFVRQCAKDLVEGKYGLGQLIISKSLRAEYANPLGIAHKVLADRIAARDPGNAPAAGDRISFVYIAPPPGRLAPKLQGDRIETPQFLMENNLTPDYMFYIEHQIANPICQMFGLLLEMIPELEGFPIPQEQGAREKKAYELLFEDAIAIHKSNQNATLLRLGIIMETPPPRKRRTVATTEATATAAETTAVPKKTRAKRPSAATTGKNATVDTYYADLAVVKATTARKRKEQKEKQAKEQSDGTK